MKHRILPGKPEDIRNLILRKEDLAELKAGCSILPSIQLFDSWVASAMRWTIWIDKKVAGVFGCSGKAGQVGVPWLLGSELLTKVPEVFVIDAPKYVDMMQERYKFLFNYVHEENRISTRWLQWLGFKLKDPAPYGEFGNPFRYFYRASNV